MRFLAQMGQRQVVERPCRT